MKTQIEKSPETKVCVMSVNPGLTTENLERVTQGIDALILIGYATGATPAIFNDLIRKRTNEGIPVFIISDNYKAPHGILEPRNYEPKILALKAGAIFIQTVNSSNFRKVLDAIKKEFSKGKRGTELGQIIKRQFSLP